MNADSEHLRLLSIFHYVVAGLAALFCFFPLLYAGMGGLFLWTAQHPGMNQNGQPPPPFLGWIFIGIGLFGFVIGLTMAILILLAGRALAQRRRYTLALVVACLECLFMPFGTVLGVFTLIVLSRESVKLLFNASPASGPPT
ncbi:MAG TPA: hypothetical protein VEI58_10345 [Chthoniobacterales bacterium]|nr:hypothetical protein [Chthoniobacterales bacterium]